MSDHITITGRSGDNANLPAVLRGYVERFELTSPMVKQMMLDAADEIERLRAALESLTKDPPATLDETDTDAEVIIKMRAIARRALEQKP